MTREVNGYVFEVSLKWYRGASRYNNGATRYGRKYQFRYLIGREKERVKGKGWPEKQIEQLS